MKYENCSTLEPVQSDTPGKCVELYRMLEFQLTEILWEYNFLSGDSGCWRTLMSDCTSFTVHVHALFVYDVFKGVDIQTHPLHLNDVFIDGPKFYFFHTCLLFRSLPSGIKYFICFPISYVKVMRSLIQIHIIFFFLNFRIFG